MVAAGLDLAPVERGCFLAPKGDGRGSAAAGLLEDALALQYGAFPVRVWASAPGSARRRKGCRSEPVPAGISFRHECSVQGPAVSASSYDDSASDEAGSCPRTLSHRQATATCTSPGPLPPPLPVDDEKGKWPHRQHAPLPQPTMLGLDALRVQGAAAWRGLPSRGSRSRTGSAKNVAAKRPIDAVVARQGKDRAFCILSPPSSSPPGPCLSLGPVGRHPARQPPAKEDAVAAPAVCVGSDITCTARSTCWPRQRA
ncbi:hypothetical protein Purlil1_9864 [Purpureocillium lilacinum]|uniref:Uncharacterized protein n=1 Tax=Purpureocillium lilacinum TaxID=33203 RepID=A0ABR0BNV0_PURLI|nr:hypothetical protein Purlil1_9864 [Purpureocillium lilacinum]